MISMNICLFACLYDNDSIIKSIYFSDNHIFHRLIYIIVFSGPKGKGCNKIRLPWKGIYIFLFYFVFNKLCIIPTN